MSSEKVPERWLALVEQAGNAVIEDQMLEPGAMADELILMAMRTSDGLDLARYASIGGAIDQGRLGDLVEENLVELINDGARLRLTPAGRLLANAVIAELASG